MKEINILVFGDSIAYGAWDNEKAGWVNRLRLSLETRGNYYYNIFNLSIPGETTTNIKKRFKSECDYRYNAEVQTIIILSIGINDSYIINGKNNTSIKEFKNNIEDLINMAKEYTDNILFIGLTNVDETKVNPLPWDDAISYLNEEIIKYDKELEIICTKHKITDLNIFNLLKIKDLSDGLHPNSIGHTKICEKILSQIKNIEFYE